MGKHSLQQDPRISNVVKGVLAMGAVAASTGAIPAIPAMASTINVPGGGSFDVPLGREFDDQVQQINQAFSDHADQLKPLLDSVTPQAPLKAFETPRVADNVPGAKALDAARTKVGAEYSWGASGPWAFDCSGFTKWAYKQAEIDIPRTSFEQSLIGRPVAYQELQPGDLIIQNDGAHVAMYAGNGQILHASQSGEPVEYAHLNPDSMVTARRIQ
ncbi:NlpC/P60 family protein [Nocardia vulneris]|uniref:C40 family peptidase n=1 Tax=Nocardia vulneris TaxID=1141657 RepID=UPI0030CE5D85